MINFYILSRRFFLKRKELSEVRVVSIIKKEYDSILRYKSYYSPKYFISFFSGNVVSLNFPQSSMYS